MLSEMSVPKRQILDDSMNRGYPKPSDSEKREGGGAAGGGGGRRVCPQGGVPDLGDGKVPEVRGTPVSAELALLCSTQRRLGWYVLCVCFSTQFKKVISVN